MDVTTTISLRLKAAISLLVESVTLQGTVDHTVTEALTDGTGAGKADLVWEDASLAIGAGGNFSLDLCDLTDAFGASVKFANLKAMMFENISTTAAVVEIGGGIVNPLLLPFDTTGLATMVLGAGMKMALVNLDAAAGWAVTEDTSDIIYMLETATLAALMRVTLIGEAA